VVISLILIPVVVLVIIAVIIAGTKLSPEGGEDMIKNVYIYLVLFATLMMAIGGSVGIFMALADIIAPAPYYQSFEDFKRWGGPDKPYPEKEVVEKEKPSEEELREQYDAMVLAEKERQVSRAKNSLIKSFGWIVIPLPVFRSFQRRLAKKEES
jgi:hypothetical protein